MSEFLSIPIFDDDFYKMMFRFFLNISFLTIIIQWLYYSTVKKRDYLFTYYMIGIIVFFLCFTLKKYELDIGMALGLFAIFGIIRYRTNPIPIKEMTYLFIIIGVSDKKATSSFTVPNDALTNKNLRLRVRSQYFTNPMSA